jgi:hypothetical protein
MIPFSHEQHETHFECEFAGGGIVAGGAGKGFV